MKLDELSRKKILIVGYGTEGKATHEFLSRMLPDSNVTITDQTNGPAYLDTQGQYDLAIKSPGVHKSLIHIPYTTATNIFFANTKGMAIGVTGTKGKSTTSSLIYTILKEGGLRVHLVGNIGNPMLSELLLEKDKDDIYVCELSSYQLDDIAYSPHISVMINFFPEHMNYHGSIEEYWNAKKRLLQFVTASDFFVYNPYSEKLASLALETKAKAIPYVDQIPFSDESIPLLGAHNRDNVKAALTVAGLLRIPVQIMEKAVKNFQPLPHRLENIGTYKGIAFYDDAISTTPESTICAIEAIPSTQTIMLGGQNRGYDFRALIEELEKHNIYNIVLFPDSGEIIKQILEKRHNKKFTILETSDMKEAVEFAYIHTPDGAACLLSTASPSYSIWKNFIEKGNIFRKFVKELSTK